MELMGRPAGGDNIIGRNGTNRGDTCCFQMPLHYPRYTKHDYETMPEGILDCILAQYGLPVTGDVNHKRKFAMGAFLWN